MVKTDSKPTDFTGSFEAVKRNTSTNAVSNSRTLPLSFWSEPGKTVASAGSFPARTRALMSPAMTRPSVVQNGRFG